MIFQIEFNPVENMHTRKVDSRELCLAYVDSFTLLSPEIDMIFSLEIGKKFSNIDMTVTRIM